MDVTMINVPSDLLSDYDDGHATMTRLMKRMSASSVVAYADQNGPRLDRLSSDNVYFSGLADGLASQCAAALDRNPQLDSSWLKGATIHVKVNGLDKTFRVERKSPDERDQDQTPLRNGTHLEL
jgi:hypothetical protein